MTNSWWHSKTGYLVALCGILVVTLLLAPFQANVNSTTVALTILVVVLIVATVFGSRPAFVASVLGVLSFNFFFLPPLYTFTIADPQNWVAFGAFLATAIIAGQLSSYARRRAEESEKRRLEIERLYDELRDAFEQASQAEALRQSEKLKSALLDAVTHDLRTPLTSIKASATTLMEDAVIEDKESRNELLEIISEEADRLNNFIGGMVDVARLEAGKLDLRKSWTDINEIVDRALKRAEIRLADRRITVRVESDLPLVRVDALSVEEVLYTLLDNAAKYSGDDSEIRIWASCGGGDTVEVSVEDKGRGIEPVERERIFEKFYRSGGEDIHTTASGLGLGLAIARGIAESQDGRLWVEDGREGFVTRFVFQVPIGDHDREELD